MGGRGGRSPAMGRLASFSHSRCRRHRAAIVAAADTTDEISGSGPGGRITRDDVLDHIDATGATKQAPAPPDPSTAAEPDKARA